MKETKAPGISWVCIDTARPLKNCLHCRFCGFGKNFASSAEGAENLAPCDEKIPPNRLSVIAYDPILLQFVWPEASPAPIGFIRSLMVGFLFP